MRTIASAVAATILLIGPLSAPSPASAGLAVPSLGAAVPRMENSALHEVAQKRRGVRYERRMRKERRVRQERRVRYERRAVRRCIRQGYCPVVYVQVPVYYYVPVYYHVPIWFSAPVYYYY